MALRKLATFESVGAELFIDDATGDVSAVENGVSTTILTAGTGASPYGSNPAMDGNASAGNSALYSRGDHVHPTDTSRAADNAVVKLTGTQSVAGAKTLAQLIIGSVAFAALGTPANGAVYYCTDADTPTSPGVTTTSAGDKAGALVMRVRGGWCSY